MRKTLLTLFLLFSLVAKPSLAQAYSWGEVVSTFKEVGAIAVKVTGKAFKKAISSAAVLVYTVDGAVECYIDGKKTSEIIECGLAAGGQKAYDNIMENLNDAKLLYLAMLEKAKNLKSKAGEKTTQAKEKAGKFFKKFKKKTE